jgi:hypothetical protein
MNKKPGPAPASKRKRLIIDLLILGSLAGLAGGIYLLTNDSSIEALAPLRNMIDRHKRNPDHGGSLLPRTAPRFHFQGTMLGEQGAVAVINDELISAGADIDGMRILSITNHTLTVEYEGKRFQLTVGQTFSP